MQKFPLFCAIAKLKEEWRKLAVEIKDLYDEYHAVQRDMREALVVKTDMIICWGLRSPSGRFDIRTKMMYTKKTERLVFWRITICRENIIQRKRLKT